MKKNVSLEKPYTLTDEGAKQYLIYMYSFLLKA